MTACSACATCRRSVSHRSPSVRASRRPGSSVSAVTASSSAATPRSCNTTAQLRTVAPSSSSSVSARGPHSSSTVRPRKHVSAAARSRASRGCSRASSSVSQSAATGVPNTLAVPVTTAGTPCAASAARTEALCSLVRTSTATSPGRTGMPSIVAALPSRRATSAARSATTSSRAGPTIGTSRRGGVGSPARGATRTRTGASAGAPISRRPARAAATGCTTIRSSPSAAPPNTVSSASSRGSSLRWLVASVAWWSAARVASR